MAEISLKLLIKLIWDAEDGICRSFDLKTVPVDVYISTETKCCHGTPLSPPAICRNRHHAEVFLAIVARITVLVVDILASNGRFAVLLFHFLASRVPRRPILDLFGSTMVLVVLFSVVTRHKLSVPRRFLCNIFRLFRKLLSSSRIPTLLSRCSSVFLAT